MSFTTKVHDAALKLDLSPRILTGMSLTDLFALLYQQFKVVPEVQIIPADADSGRSANFTVWVKRLSGSGKDLKIEEDARVTINTCSLQEAYEEAFVNAVNYIKENNIPFNA